MNNAAGFGFSGVDKNGNFSWDLLSNLNIWKIEVSSSCFGIKLPSWIKQFALTVVSLDIHQCPRKICHQEMPGPASGTFCILELLFFFFLKIPTFLVVLMVQGIMTHEQSEKKPGKSFCCLHSCSIHWTVPMSSSLVHILLSSVKDID